MSLISNRYLIMIQRNATHVVRNKRYVKKNMVDNDRNIFEIPTI